MARPHPALVALAAGRHPGPLPGSAALVTSAIDHGMQGLLWTHVADLGDGAGWRRTLAGADVAIRQRHDRLWDTLATVRDRLAAVDVELATVKGVTAEARWYGRPGERPSTDLDVVVPPAAATRADEVLDVLQPGHALRSHAVELATSSVMQSVNTIVDGVAVDLHFDILKYGLPPRQRDLAWERTVLFPLGDGSTVRVLDPELALVHFLVHLNMDSFSWLLGLADVARVLRGPVDWGFVERFVRNEGLEVVVYRSLTTVSAELSLPLPPLPRIRGPRVWLWDAAWPPPATLLGSAGTHRSRRQDLLPFLVRGRLAAAGRWGLHVLLPPRAAVAARYGGERGPYLVRLLRGRVRTVLARRTALRTRRLPEDRRYAPATAALLREAVGMRPLWLDVHGSSMGRSIPDGARRTYRGGGPAPPWGGVGVHGRRWSSRRPPVPGRGRGRVAVPGRHPGAGRRSGRRGPTGGSGGRGRTGSGPMAVGRAGRSRAADAPAAVVAAARQWRR